MIRAAALAVLAAAPLAAETVAISSAPVRFPDSFWREAGRRLEIPAARLEALAARGYGRTEILILGAFVHRSSQTLDSLTLVRERGRSLRSMAVGLGLEYDGIFREAEGLRQEIEFEVRRSTSAGRP